MQHEGITDEEIEILMNDLLETFGYDFTNYSRASIKRRVNRLIVLDKFTGLESLRKRLLHDEKYLRRFIQEITVNVTEMFRNPSFYRMLREQVVPVLATHPFIRVWHAGCSTGEEVYSMAILLREAGILQKSLIYATDINPEVLEKLAAGIYPLGSMKLFSENYIRCGGTEDFSSYYTARFNHAKFNDDLKARLIVSTHNLVSDGSFNEFQLIICRNVLIYFNKQLQDKVLELFDSSLEILGFLALGDKEQIKFSGIGHRYTQLDRKEKIWKKYR